MGFIWYIIIGIIAGFLAGKIMRGGGFGLIINLLLGILGGVLGGWVFALFGLAASGLIGSLITMFQLPHPSNHYQFCLKPLCPTHCFQ